MKRFCSVAAGCVLTLVSAPVGVSAQEYPTRPIEMIIPWVAGGGVDIVGRAMASAMSSELGQNVVVLNRDGAAGTIGFNALAAAQPNGYTLGGGPTTPIANAPFLVKNVRYDVNSFDYVCQYFENVFSIAVREESPFKTAQELIAYAKANPGKLTYGHAGPGTIPHLAAENFAEALGIQFRHVPFRGDAPMIPALLSGEVEFGSTALASIRRHKTRVLVVFADKRHPNWPDVPTAQELGVAQSVPPGHNGIFLPKGAPDAVKKRLETACANAVKSETVRKTIEGVGGLITYLNAEQFRAQTVADFAFKRDLIRRLGLEVK
jgi:tripartite-type tricarboxylate transporter receptor subunit TctC